MIFSCIGVQNQIIGCEISEENSLGVISVEESKANRKWWDHFSRRKPAVFLLSKGYDAASVGKDLDHLLCGSSLEDFYFRVS